MMERVWSSMNSTRTWVTPPREPIPINQHPAAAKSVLSSSAFVPVRPRTRVTLTSLTGVLEESIVANVRFSEAGCDRSGKWTRGCVGALGEGRFVVRPFWWSKWMFSVIRQGFRSRAGTLRCQSRAWVPWSARLCAQCIPAVSHPSQAEGAPSKVKDDAVLRSTCRQEGALGIFNQADVAYWMRLPVQHRLDTLKPVQG